MSVFNPASFASYGRVVQASRTPTRYLLENPMKHTHQTLRAYFSITAALLFAVLILLAGAEGFLRNTLGDYLVVLLLYAIARTVKPTKFRLLPIALFAFAVLVEVVQYMDLLSALGITNETVVIAVGSVFDWLDIAVYALASITAAVADYLIARKADRE